MIKKWRRTNTKLSTPSCMYCDYCHACVYKGGWLPFVFHYPQRLQVPLLTFDNLYLTYQGSTKFAIDAQYVDLSGLSGYAHTHSSSIELTASLYAYTSEGDVYFVWGATTSDQVALPTMACSFGTIKTVTRVQFVSSPPQDNAYHDMIGEVLLSKVLAPALQPTPTVACVEVSLNIWHICV